MNLKKIVTNKLVLYLVSRYLTYFLQFITSLIIAVKLGPYYFGVWGFITLLMNYFRIVNFGISNASNILLVQNKKDEIKISKVVKASLFLLSAISLVILLLAFLYERIQIEAFQKYELNEMFYAICAIAILTHFNMLFMNIYRFKNRLFEVAFYQSIIPLLVFLSVFLLEGKELLYLLLGVYLLGNVIALGLFVFRKQIVFNGKLETVEAKRILNKGFFLFVYNLSFYLIILSIKTLVSLYYSVEEFGYFTFAFSLANAILLFLQALVFVVFPKIIDKLKGSDSKRIMSLITEIREAYVSLAFALVFVAIMVFPILLYFLPKYQTALQALQLVALTIVLFTNSFGYGTYLMAQNKEKSVAYIALLSLIINVLLALFLIFYLKVSYSYVILATTFAYSLYAFFCVYKGHNVLEVKSSLMQKINDSFPIRLLVPYLVALVLILNNMQSFVFVPLLIFIAINVTAMKKIVLKIKTIINKPNVVDL